MFESKSYITCNRLLSSKAFSAPPLLKVSVTVTQRLHAVRNSYAAAGHAYSSPTSRCDAWFHDLVVRIHFVFSILSFVPFFPRIVPYSKIFPLLPGCFAETYVFFSRSRLPRDHGCIRTGSVHARP